MEHTNESAVRSVRTLTEIEENIKLLGIKSDLCLERIADNLRRIAILNKRLDAILEEKDREMKDY